MTRSFNLIKTETEIFEKRIFPRFPFSFITFRAQGEKVYEVKDISYTGMQIHLRDGGVNLKKGNEIHGEIHWRSKKILVTGEIKWIRENSVGIAFDLNKNAEDKLKDFLSIDNMLSNMRVLHGKDWEFEVPSNLKYWLRSDGPVELFVWQHSDGELSRFQLIMLDSFVEWEDGVGLRTGKVITKRDLDTPLVMEDEMLFRIDEGGDIDKLKFAYSIIERLPEGHLPDDVWRFVKVKLGNYKV